MRSVCLSICDYAMDDLAREEVQLSLLKELPDIWEIVPASVSPFKTLEIGFKLQQHAGSSLAEEGGAQGKFLIFANSAPRKDKEDEKRKGNEGEGLVYGELDNGVRIVAVNSDYSLSFVRDRFNCLYEAKFEPTGSQFRSRDNFPKVVGHIARNELDAVLGEQLNPQKVIRKLPKNRIAYIDNFGNLKTTIRGSDPDYAKLKEGQQVRVVIGRNPRSAVVARGNFGIHEGELAFGPGSSGWGDMNDHFVELFLRGGSAQRHFSDPETEQEIKWTVIP